MYFFYNTALILLTILLSPFLGIVLFFRRKYRCGFFKKFGLLSWEQLQADLGSRPIWVHAVSVGEVMAAIPLIREIKKKYAGVPVLLSTVTETGNFTARRNAKEADKIIFFPFDYPFVGRRIIAKIKPLVFVALETEIWPNFLKELNRQSIPAMIVSGRISNNSFRKYFFFRFFFKKVLSDISFFCMQTPTDAARIISIGTPHDKVTVTGNIKFDQQAPAITPQEQTRMFEELKIDSRQKIFIAGSTHRGEEKIVMAVYKALKKKFSDLVLILAPRHPERFDEVETMLRQSGMPFIRKTVLETAAPPISANVILLDTIGELAKIYSIGTIVFIGGSLVPVGGHNVLEPALFSRPVIFGKFMGNFAEIANILLSKNGAIQVADKDEFIEKAMPLLEDPNLCRQIGGAAFEVIRKNSGAVAKSMKIIEAMIAAKNSSVPN